MNKILKILSLILLVICLSCEEMRLYDCSNCLENEPVDAFLDIRLKQFSSDEVVQYNVRIYRGKSEDNVLIDERTVRDSYRIKGNINQEYSAIATLVRNDIVYKIVSSTTPKVVDRSDFCENTCFMIKNDEIDLRLKYE